MVSNSKRIFAKFKTVFLLATVGALSVFAGDQVLARVAPETSRAVHKKISKVGNGLKKTLKSAHVSTWDGTAYVCVGG